MSLECSIKMSPTWLNLLGPMRPMPASADLDDADFAVVVALLKQTIAADRYPLSRA